MNFEEKIKEMLTGSGMFDSQADAVMSAFKEDERFDSFEGRWHEEVDAYPPVMVQVVWLGVKRVGLEWIEENIPDAWYKPLFMEKNDELGGNKQEIAKY